jgi:hypothetical protein
MILNFHHLSDNYLSQHAVTCLSICMTHTSYLYLCLLIALDYTAHPHYLKLLS